MVQQRVAVVNPILYQPLALALRLRDDLPGKSWGGVMRSSIVVVGSLLAATSLARGADLPMPGPAPSAPAVYAPAPPPAYDWSGFYIGANGGYGFASANTTDVFTGGVLGGLVASGSGNASGGVAGGQIGYNYQINAAVLGIEGDFDWSGQSKTTTVGCGVGCTISGTSKIPWLATIRGRAGVAIDRVLIYGTAGVAFTDVSDSVSATGVGSIFSASSTNVGWTAGVGVEAALAQNWTVRAEYLFVQTNATLSGPLTLLGGTVSESGTINDSIVRAGLNFKYP